MTVVEIIGFTGSGLVIWAYVPQINHLVKAHCSAGISRRAYALWFIAALLLLVHAIMIRDSVFTFLQSTNLILTLVILVFARKYKNEACPIHQFGKNFS